MTPMRSQVTTKRGDSGETSTLGKETVSKSHPIVDCTGALDELRAETALTRALILRDHPEDAQSVADFLLWLLHVFFIIGSQCSDPENKHPEFRKVDLSTKHLQKLEAEQADLEEKTKLPKQFIVCASNAASARMDVTTTVARRFERSLVKLKDTYPAFDTSVIFPFVNRLSDTLYMLARFLERGDHQTVDYSIL